MPGGEDRRAPAPARACRRRIARNDVADRSKCGSSRAFSAQSIFSRTHKGRTAAPLPSAPPHDSALRGPSLVAGGRGIPDSTVTEPDSQVSEAGANPRDHRVQTFFRRPGRGRRALRLAASVFLRLWTRPPFRPFCLFARFLASLRTKPPNRPRATACGFLPLCFFSNALHPTSPSKATRLIIHNDANRFAL